MHAYTGMPDATSALAAVADFDVPTLPITVDKGNICIKLAFHAPHVYIITTFISVLFEWLQ